MKYIIELPDKNKHIYINENNVLFLRGTIFKEKLFGKVETHDVHICTGINAFPYYDPDRKAIEDEVWEFASMLMRMHPDVANSIYISMNGGKGIGVASEMDYQEAKSKYDAWQEEKEEIHIGDEVKFGSRSGVVVRIDTEPKDSGVNVVCREGNTAYIGMADVTKTGRHFDEVEKLLERMKAE